MAHSISYRQYYLIALLIVCLFIIGAFVVQQNNLGIKADTNQEPHLPDYSDTNNQPVNFAPDIFSETTDK